MREALDPLVETIAELSARIEELDRELRAEARGEELPVRLQEIPGVGPLVALSLIAWVDRPERFETSRDVGASLGLRPILRFDIFEAGFESGDTTAWSNTVP